MHKKYLLIFPTLASIFIYSLPAHAKTSKWMNASEFERFSSRVLVRKDLIPKSIKCKAANNTVGLTRKNTLLKVTYGKSSKRVSWEWAWGTYVGKTHAHLSKRGFKRVSFFQTRRKSGLKLACAIWHKVH